MGGSRRDKLSERAKRLNDPTVVAESKLTLDALDNVGCVEVSHDVAERLGAFEEEGVLLDDVIDGGR